VAEISQDPGPAILAPRNSDGLNDLYKSKEFGLAWDNDIHHHIARSALYLRRHRRKSQAEVAEAMGTSQSAVARIEAGEENITLSTLHRLITALEGRFFVTIVPAEIPFNRPSPWWAPITRSSTTEWTMKFFAYQRTADAERAVLGVERDTSPNRSLLVENGTTW
jgi:transcriptional regulator with XRE-family HTH domain